MVLFTNDENFPGECMSKHKSFLRNEIILYSRATGNMSLRDIIYKFDGFNLFHRNNLSVASRRTEIFVP